MEIVNKVANSGLITFDWEDFYPKNPRVFLDITPFLHEGFLLMEKPFRVALENKNWNEFQGKFVAIGCSSDALLPSWAYSLVSKFLQPYSTYCTVGSLSDLEREIFLQLIEKIDVSSFQDKKVLLKGCSKYSIPESAYTQITQKLLPVVQSLAFGEACSSVPLFKRK